MYAEGGTSQTCSTRENILKAWPLEESDKLVSYISFFPLMPKYLQSCTVFPGCIYFQEFKKYICIQEIGVHGLTVMYTVFFQPFPLPQELMQSKYGGSDHQGSHKCPISMYLHLLYGEYTSSTISQFLSRQDWESLSR